MRIRPGGGGGGGGSLRSPVGAPGSEIYTVWQFVIRRRDEMRNYAPLRARIIFRAFACAKKYTRIINLAKREEREKERESEQRKEGKKVDNYTRRGIS